jgi:MoxR-like ATPase
MSNSPRVSEISLGLERDIQDAAVQAYDFINTTASNIDKFVLKYEDEAVRIAIKTMLDPEPGHTVLGGEFGGGKSSLMMALGRAANLSPEEVAIVRGRADQGPSDIVGKLTSLETEEETLAQGTQQVTATSSKRIKHRKNGKLYADAGLFLFDEPNRVPPKTLDAVNTVYASGELEIDDVLFPMENLLASYQGINPKEPLTEVFKMPNQINNRAIRGVVMGSRRTAEARIRARRNWRKAPQLMVASEVDLWLIRELVPQVPIPEQTKEIDYFEAAVLQTQEELDKVNISGSDGRLYDHLESAAKVNALVDRRAVVRREDIDLAVKEKIAAAIISSHKENYEDLAAQVAERAIAATRSKVG